MSRLALAFALALPLPAAAECAGDIAQMFKGGAFDPFVRPNRREVTVSTAPDGSETLISDVLWDGPIKSVNCTGTMCAMYVGNQMWVKQAGDGGEWIEAPSQLSDDPEGFARKIADDMAANLTDTECSAGELDGAPVKIYRYRTKSNPNEFGSWWGGLYTAYVDVATGQMIRLEETEAVSIWAADPDPAVSVTTISYDDGIAISAPEE